MIAAVTEFVDLPAATLAWIAAAVFLAGLVRGFAGFALSAIVMASASTAVAPVELIPLCFLLECAASLAMVRAGARDADMGVAWTLALSSTLGVPLGLLATVSIPVTTSQLIVLCLILSLTLAQLFRVVPPIAGGRAGLCATGLASGVVTGLASVGGMVIALYVLSRNDAPRAMRGALVMYLFITMFTSFASLLLYGLLDAAALRRSVILAPIVLTGVFIGSWLFRPSLAGFYKRFCLSLLVALSAAGLARMAAGA